MSIRGRIIACLCILSVLVSLVILSQMAGTIVHTPEYTEFNDGISATTGSYFIENWNGKGRLYLINRSGDVLEMTNSGELNMDMIHNIDIANDSVYASYSTVREYAEEKYYIYSIACYTPDLKLLSYTPDFLMDDNEVLKSLDVDSDYLYLTTIGNDGDRLNVYQIPMEALQEPDQAAPGYSSLSGTKDIQEYFKGLQKPVSIVYRETDDKSFFADAYFDGTNAVIRMSSDALSGKFLPDYRVKSSVDAMHFNIAQQMTLYSNYVIWWIGSLLIWFILMAIIYILLRRRNRSVYVLVITLVIYMILLAGAFYFVKHHYDVSETRQNVRYAVLAMRQQLDYWQDLDNAGLDDPDFYESDDYTYFVRQLKRYMNSGHNKTVFRDIFIMKKSTGSIMVDAVGMDREIASFVYGGALDDIEDQMKKHASNATETFWLENKLMMAVALPDDNPASDYCMVTICYTDAARRYFWDDSKKVLALFISVFIIGSLVIGLIFYLENLDLKALEHAMRDTALGRTKLKVPEIPSQDMMSMWNSLSEICKRMEEINYEKFRIFEAYYRFAPKNIETIMGKDSIFDVNNGDMTRVKGTLMLLASRKEGFGEKKVKSLSNIMSYMSQFSDEQEGILVSQDSSLSVLQFLFLEDYVSTAVHATQFLHRNSSDADADFVSGFLYDDYFIYGVAGVKAQSLSFLTSPHLREMEDYAVWFRDQRIPLVITEGVAEREDPGQTRFIGFIILDSDGQRVNLFEVIDAEVARLRQIKLTTREKFEETLELFYSKEYYLARNQFSEILKECPEDNLVKWYLFESERYLNGENKDGDEGRLRIFS